LDNDGIKLYKVKNYGSKKLLSFYYMLQFKLNDANKNWPFVKTNPTKNAIVDAINIDAILINFLLWLISLINN